MRKAAYSLEVTRVDQPALGRQQETAQLAYVSEERPWPEEGLGTDQPNPMRPLRHRLFGRIPSEIGTVWCPQTVANRFSNLVRLRFQ